MYFLRSQNRITVSISLRFTSLDGMTPIGSFTLCADNALWRAIVDRNNEKHSTHLKCDNRRASAVNMLSTVLYHVIVINRVCTQPHVEVVSCKYM